MANKLILNKHLVLHTKDSSYAFNRLKELICPNKTTIVGDKSELDVVFSSLSLGAINICYLSYGTDVNIDIECLEDTYIVKIPLSGKCITTADDKKVSALSNSGNILSVGHHFNMEFEKGYQEILVCISRSHFENFFCSLIDAPVRLNLSFDPLLDLNEGAGRLLKEMVFFLIQEAENPDSLIMSSESMLKSYDDMMLNLLTTGVPHDKVELLNSACGVDPLIDKKIKPVIDYIEENYEKDISISMLSDVAKINLRSLQLYFKKALSVTPAHYLRDVRLSKFNELLSKANNGDSVAELAFSCGFNHLGHCGKYYKQRYGEAPSETLKKLKK